MKRIVFILILFICASIICAQEFKEEYYEVRAISNITIIRNGDNIVSTPYSSECAYIYPTDSVIIKSNSILKYIEEDGSVNDIEYISLGVKSFKDILKENKTKAEKEFYFFSKMKNILL